MILLHHGQRILTRKRVNFLSDVISSIGPKISDADTYIKPISC